MTRTYIAAFAVALVVSAGMLPWVIRLATRLGVVDRPGGRRTHRGLVPRLGGIAIALGVGSGIAAALILGKRAFTVVQPEQYPWYGPALGLFIVFAGGLLDDIRQYSAGKKLMIQLLATAVAVAGGVRIDGVTLPGFGIVELGVFGSIAAFAWILLVTNAMNLIDGMDGLAGGLAFITAATLAAISSLNGQFAMVVCSFALAGAVLGFLVFNFNPARVFMGDGGSQFLGFFIAILSIRGCQKGPTAIAISVPLMILGVPLLDLGTTIARRVRKRGVPGPSGILGLVRRVSQADREHLHHNLLAHGLSPRRAVAMLYGVAGLFALSAYLSVASSSIALAAAILALSVVCVAAIKLSAASVNTWDQP